VLNDWLRKNCWFLLVLAVAFVAVGFFVGRLVGQSRAPAIPALLPLLVGLLGGFSYALFEKRVTLATLLGKVEEVGVTKQLPPDTLASLRAEVEKEGDTSLVLPAFWAACIVLFSIAAAEGLRYGIAERVPAYPELGTFLGDRRVPPEQRALLYQLEVACRSAGLSPGKYSEVMQTVVVPLLDEPERKGTEYFPNKESRLKAIVDGFRQNRIDDILRPVGKNVDDPLPK
jgi:hypothetical protein